MNKNELINQLEQEYTQISNDINNNKYCCKVGFCIRISKLERVFIDIFAAKLNMNQTKCIEKIIKKLMKKYPTIVDEAKKRIDSEEI